MQVRWPIGRLTGRGGKQRQQSCAISYFDFKLPFLQHFISLLVSPQTIELLRYFLEAKRVSCQTTYLHISSFKIVTQKPRSMPEYIEIDPEGDVILVLATVEEEEESVNDFTDSWSRVRAPPKPDLTETESSTTNKKGKRKGRKRYQCILCSRLITDGDVHICGSLDTNEEPAAANYVCVKCLAEFNNAGDLHRHYGRDCLSPVQKEPPNHTDSPTAEDTAINSETVMPSGSQESRVRVSSKHLSLSSSVFKALFSRKFSEGGHLRTKGSIELPLPDDHSAALLILLNLVHGRIRRVPKILGLDMLTQVAVLVDKYDMGEAVTLFSEIWISEINEKIPAIMSESVVQWICISWVFDRRREFKAATRVAQNFAESTIDKYAATALPIPSMVIGEVPSPNSSVLD